MNPFVLFVLLILFFSGCRSSRISELQRENEQLRRATASTVTRDYQALQHASSTPQNLSYRYYEFQLPEHTVDGVLRDPQSRIIEVVE